MNDIGIKAATGRSSTDLTDHGIAQVLIERAPYERGAREERAAAEAALVRGIPVRPTAVRELPGLPIGPGCLCVGTVPFVRAALAAGDRKLPLHDPYPPTLQEHLHRATGQAARLHELARADKRLFVKPMRGWKRWTGYVMDGAPRRHRNDAVWWSEPVTWLSEWRAYVVRGSVLAIERTPHTPDDGPKVDESLVAAAAKKLYASPNAAAGLALDFGVLSTGQTALVEVNDGFSIGAYGTVTPETMWAVWSARWPQLWADVQGSH